MGLAYSVSLEYNKRVPDLATGTTGTATTWAKKGSGAHGGDAANILSFVAKITHMCINEYLRLNDQACAPASRQ